MSILQIENLNFSYPDGTVVFDAFNFRIESPGVTVIFGTSGSGKSTLCRLLLRLNGNDDVYRQIIVDGKHLNTISDTELYRSIGYVSQRPDYQLIGGSIEQERSLLSGIEQNRLDTVLREIHLDHLRDRPMNALSGGERQKFAVALQLIRNPKIIILDEPFSQTDYPSARQLTQDLITFSQSAGTAVLIFEHREAVFAGFDVHRLSLGPTSEPIYESKSSKRTKGEPLLQVRQLSVRLDQSKVVHDVSMDVHSGERVAVIGANGCGKTTFFQAVCGLIDCEGDVLLKGRPGMLFQQSDLMLTESSVSEAVPDRALRIRLDVQSVADRHPFQLSVGQRERVAIGKLINRSFSVLFLDEPDIGQDPAHAAALIDCFRSLSVAIVFSSHDLEFAMHLADRILVMANGRIQQEIIPPFELRQCIEALQIQQTDDPGNANNRTQTGSQI